MASAPEPPSISLWDLLRSAWSWAVLVVVTITFSSVMALVTVLTAWAAPTRAIVHRLGAQWARTVLACHPWWKLTVQGREHLPAGRPCVLVSNHQSLLDILVLFCIDHHFKWVAKDSLFRVPFLGLGLWAEGDIPLVRGEFGSIRVTYDRARVWLGRGVSVCFFPEGTRSPTGEIQPFKNGAFKLAVEAGLPVVPIAVSGTRDILRRGGRIFSRAAQLRITILPPLMPAPGEPMAFARLRDEAQAAIAASLQTNA